jgi:predicted DsbA family dithiol-disulfide isomerase
MRVDVWSDLVCPWCYIGKRRFERAVAASARPEEIELVHRSFQLNPAAPRDRTTSRAEHLAAKYGWSAEQVEAANARLEQLAAAEGLEYRLAGGVTGNTFDAHRLIHFARDAGKEDAALERLYRAFFTEQRSIFDPASLADLAADADLPREEVSRMLGSDAYASAVANDVREAAALGIRGVPFFVFDGRFGVSGAQSVETLADALNRAGANGR